MLDYKLSSVVFRKPIKNSESRDDWDYKQLVFPYSEYGGYISIIVGFFANGAEWLSIDDIIAVYEEQEDFKRIMNKLSNIERVEFSDHFADSQIGRFLMKTGFSNIHNSICRQSLMVISNLVSDNFVFYSYFCSLGLIREIGNILNQGFIAHIRSFFDVLAAVFGINNKNRAEDSRELLDMVDIHHINNFFSECDHRSLYSMFYVYYALSFDYSTDFFETYIFSIQTFMTKIGIDISIQANLDDFIEEPSHSLFYLFDLVTNICNPDTVLHLMTLPYLIELAHLSIDKSEKTSVLSAINMFSTFIKMCGSSSPRINFFRILSSFSFF